MQHNRNDAVEDNSAFFGKILVSKINSLILKNEQKNINNIILNQLSFCLYFFFLIISL